MNKATTIRLLLVEDNPGDILLAREALDVAPGSRFEITQAFTLSAGLSQLSSAESDVVVLDLNLPDSSGLETLRRLRAAHPEIPVVVLSGTSTEEFYWEAFREGAQDCIPKGDLAIRLLGRSVLYALERHRAQAIQHQSEKLVLSNPDAIVVADSNGIVRFVNDAALGFFDRSREEFLGAAFGYPLPEDQITEIVVDAFPESRIGSMRATRVQWYEEPACFAVIRDVTENNRLQVQLRQALKLQALGTVAGGIAHDFNNILPAITINAQLALSDVVEGSPAHQSLVEILKAGDRARDLVGRILAYCRQEEPPREGIQLRAVIDEALSMIRSTLPATVELRVDISRDLPSVLANAGDLTRVLVNLCSNAGEALARNDGRVEISACEVTHLAGDPGPADLLPGRYVRLMVADNGHGMDPGTVERIFDPFFTTRGRSRGTGLGLSVVHGIVESHGGAISVESKPGQGSTFSIYLPISGESALTKEQNEQAPSRGGGRRVLYVDDDEAMVFLVARTLKRLGYEVDATTDAKAALKGVLTAPDQYDLIVSDLAMPDISGFELLSEIRGAKLSIPFLLVSGFVDADTTETARELGATTLILKPATVEALAEAVDRTAHPVEAASPH